MVDMTGFKSAADPWTQYLQKMGGQQSQLGSGYGDLSGGTLPQAGGAPEMGLGMNIPTAQLAIGGLNSLGNLWQSWNASKLAKKQFDFTKQHVNTNLNNSIRSYNTALTDRSNTRAVMEGRSAESAQAYTDEHAMRRG